MTTNSTRPSRVRDASYDSARQWYGATPVSARRWRWARAAAVAGSGSARYAKIGDSISAGQGLQPATQAPPQVMARMLAAGGLPVRGASVILNPRTMTGDARLSFGGSWTEVADHHLMSLAESRRADSWARLTTTTEVEGPHVLRVIHARDSGDFSIQLDGKEPAGVPTMTGTGLAVHTVSVPRLDVGSHTLEVKATSARPVRLASIGIESTNGIACCDFGISMSTTEDWVAGGNPLAPLEHVKAWAPDLALVALMTNDANNGQVVPPSRYATNLKAIVEVLSPTCDVVLEVQIPGDPAWVDLEPYREAVYDVADATGVMVVDLFDRWGSFEAAAAKGLMLDAFHPSAAGAADIAAAEYALVVA